MKPAPVQGLDGQLEHEVEAILKFSMRAGRPHVLRVVRWTVSMLPVKPGSLWRILLTVRMLFVLLSRLAPLPPHSQACGEVAPPLLPTGFSTSAHFVLVQCGYPTVTAGRRTVARICASSASGFTHVVAYTQQTSAARWTPCWTLLPTGNTGPGCCFCRWRLRESSVSHGGTAR